MKKSMFFMFVAASLLFVGCSAPKPITLDGKASTTINQGIITERQNTIIQDRFLLENNWTYDLVIKPTKKELVPDSLRVKVSYLAHHADKITIVGKNAEKFKAFFIKEGIKAPIEVWLMDEIRGDSEAVNVSFFHKAVEK